MTVMSYRDRMDFGIVTDREQINDPWPLMEGAAQALEELEHAIGIGRPTPHPTHAPKRSAKRSSRARVAARGAG
jgi:hypothetical protein